MLAPRVVVIHRRTELDELVDRHGTRGQAAFFLRSRGRDLTEVQSRHDANLAALRDASAAIPSEWRRGHVERADLDRFLFEPEDIVLVVGQDGLVANVAKYLSGQLVIGVDPEPERNPGVLVRHQATETLGLLASIGDGRADIESRTMVVASVDDGQTLLALNEVYLGHPTHQSARYRLVEPAEERQSSSGLIVTSGTGATGWCASIVRERSSRLRLPRPDDPALAWFVREAWPSPATGVSHTEGLLELGSRLVVVVEADGLTAFGDGLEGDRLVVSWGQEVRIEIAEQRLHVVTGRQPSGDSPERATARTRERVRAVGGGAR